MNFLFRRSASIAAASARKRTLVAALLSSEILGLPQALPSPATAVFHAAAHIPEKRRLVGVPRRDIHTSAGPLRLRATDAAPAGYAVANLYNDESMPQTAPAENKADEGLEIAKLGISPQIVDQLAKKGITKLFPIQRAVLEPAMQGRDMIGRAKTGTGKTLAFGIPIMDKILRFCAEHGRGRNPLALVLAPTRELARQVEKEFRESAPLDTICVYGGTPIQQQMRALEYGVDVVVGTPGRVIDLLNRGTLVLSQVQFIVLDEADQMLAVGFAEDVEKILEKLPLQRQGMMFSATMPPAIRELTRKYLKDPLTIDLVGENDQKLAEGITLYSIASENYAKPSILGTLIKEHAKGGKCIVFTRTKRDADQLAYTMGRTLGCEPLHGDISQNQRERTLAGFRDGRFNILIATDVAARGLDIPNVDLVIHYELPNTSELFVHRSGRTGRAGKKGSAILIYTQEQSRLVRGIEQDIACRFTELPSITVEGGGMLGGMGGQREYFAGGRMGSQGFSYGGSGGYRGSNYGGGNGGYRGSNYGGSYGFGNPGRAAVDVESMPDRFRSGSGLPGGSFGSSGFGHPGRPRESGLGHFGSSTESSTGGFGSFSDSGTGRFGSFGNSSNYGGSYGFGNPGRAAVDVESMPDRFRSGSGLPGGSFGSSGFGHPGRPRESGLGHFGSSTESGTGGFGSSSDSGTGRFGSFGNSGPARSNIFGGGGSGQENTDNSWPGRSFMSSS